MIEYPIVVGDYEKPDIDPASYEINAGPGCVVVQMIPVRDKVGSIYMPENYQEESRLDLGVVLAVGGGVQIGKVFCDPSKEMSPGDVVAIDYRFGKVVEGFGWGDNALTDEEIRFYGVANAGGKAKRYPYWKAVVMKDMKPLGKQMLVNFREQADEGVILLADSAKKKESVCEVVACGPLCELAKPGMKLVISSKSTKEVLSEGSSNVYICDEDAILAFYDEEPRGTTDGLHSGRKE